MSIHFLNANKIYTIVFTCEHTNKHIHIQTYTQAHTHHKTVKTNQTW